MRLALVALAFVLLAVEANAQTAQVVAACGTPPGTYTVGTVRNLTQDVNGRLCVGTAAAPFAAVGPALQTQGTALQLQAAPKPKKGTRE